MIRRDADFQRQLTQVYPTLDEDVIDYVAGFVRDTPDAELGADGDGLFEFLQPLIVTDDSVTFSEDTEQLRDLCRKFASTHVSAGANDGADQDRSSALAAPVQMGQMPMVSAAAEYTVPKKLDDISLTMSRRLPGLSSQVDRKKLEKAEARSKQKLAGRDAKEKASQIEFVDITKDRTDYHALNTLIDPTSAKGKPKDVKLEDFDISFGGKRILVGADMTLVFGRRYGLIGRNGVGKSTLLRAVARRDIADKSKHGGVPDWLRILHVEQEIEGDDTPVLHSVLNADVLRVSLMAQEKQLTAELNSIDSQGLSPADLTARKDEMGQKLKEVYVKLQFVEADKAESTASVILTGLGFSPAQQMQPTKIFSGGWRMRIALARALFCKPDILLCDEPTNHMDLVAVVWFEKYLQKWPNTLLVVSHDRDFLDEVCTDIIHMHNEHLDSYKGNYSMFLGTRLERRKNQLKEYEAQLQYRQHLQAFIDRWRFNAKRAPQAQSKLKVLEKLPELVPPEDDGVDDGELKFRWPDPVDKLSPPILQANEVSFSYDVKNSDGFVTELPVLKKVSFSVLLDSRVAIVGPNGAGKTTLLKLLVGQLDPKAGIIQRHGRLRLAYFSQHHVDALETDMDVRKASSVDFIMSRSPGRPEEEYRGMLARFGITGNTALQPIQTLSGGQKSRVVFALMAINNPHILVLYVKN